MAAGYTATLKRTLTGDPATPLVWVCNFEVEREWARGHTGLPGGGATGDPGAVVRRMEELGILIAEPGDHVVLSEPVDPGLREHLDGLGLALADEVVVTGAGPGVGTGRALLEDDGARQRLAELARSGARLLAMGVSADEQKLGEVTGLPLASADSETAARVNSKIYSRRLVEAAGLRPIPGACCESVDDLRDVLTPLPDADSPVIVKDALGVSGRGLLVLDDARRAEGLLRMVQRRADRTGDPSLEVVVERFLPKRHDVNYQLTLGPDGGTRFDFVKRARTERGVHQGHVVPSGLGADLEREMREAAEAIGARLHADGFFGVVGVDALVDVEGALFPVVEINARLNMSTYQGRVLEHFLPADGAALAGHFPLRLARPVSFAEVHDALGGLLDPARPGGGLVPACFGTVNASDAENGEPFDGRLYAVVVGPDADAVGRTRTAAAEALCRLPVVEEVR